MIKRSIAAELRLLESEYPVITLLGPRQSGKTTLARASFPAHNYVNLEDPEERDLAREDPRAFFSLHPAPLVLDEIQRVPELCSWIQVLNVRDLGAFERFLGLLAGRIGQLVNLSALASDSGVSSTTLGAWLEALEASFIVYRLKPFHENLGKRLVKSPKLYLSDVGLACALLGIRSPSFVARDKLLGGLFENLVVMEAVKQYCNRGETPPLYFYRDQNGREVDLVIDRDRRLVPVEVKAAMTWTPEFAKGVEWFGGLSSRADRGFVVYAGE